MLDIVLGIGLIYTREVEKEEMGYLQGVRVTFGQMPLWRLELGVSHTRTLADRRSRQVSDAWTGLAGWRDQREVHMTRSYTQSIQCNAIQCIEAQRLFQTPNASPPGAPVFLAPSSNRLIQINSHSPSSSSW